MRDAFVASVTCAVAVRELPDEPGVDRAEREALAAAVLAEEPLELRRREVRVGDEPGALAQQVGVELTAALRGSAVLPDDRGRDRPSRRALPEQRRLALVRDRDRVDAVEPRLPGGVEDALPDLLRIVLDPAGPREVLRHLGVATPVDTQLVVDDEARGAGRALVDREDHGRRPQECWAMNASVRSQASSDASANSSCLRSKKLCGAPS